MKIFIIDLLERAIKTAAQTALAGLGASITFEVVDWYHVLSIVGMAFIASILTSIASISTGDKGTASLIKGVDKN
ncbi:MAG: holin [Lachnospiraceae bacterium]|nr:holin [Lachnospiraceae bacterium]